MVLKIHNPRCTAFSARRPVGKRHAAAHGKIKRPADRPAENLHKRKRGECGLKVSALQHRNARPHDPEQKDRDGDGRGLTFDRNLPKDDRAENEREKGGENRDHGVR